jgi:ketosteroid isomerase-like protein
MPDPDATELVVRALEAAATGDHSLISDTFTEDVVGWSPNLSVSSRDELEAELADRDQSLSDVELVCSATAVGADRVVAEWVVSATHVGPLVLDDEVVLEPSNQEVVLAGATFAELRDGRICSFRHYFDDAALLEQLLLAD